MARLRLWVPVVVAAVTIAGCYGSTEPATNIKFDGATLNAQGTANNGPAESWFEIRPTNSGDLRETQHRTWPAGVSGPFSDDSGSLVPHTSYSFRLCGKDAGGDPVCAQTRTFTTLDGDTVSGRFLSEDHTHGVLIDAQSGPHGERLSGSMLFTAGADVYHRENVDCLKLSGNRAIVGNSGVMYVVDAATQRLLSPTSGSPPPCASATFDQFTTNVPTSYAQATVHDAP
jgi:hypothetical protein